MSRFRLPKRPIRAPASPQPTPSSPMVPPAGVLKEQFSALLTEQVRPFLRDQGFAKSGPTFRRRRGPLHDVINFQGSSVNGAGPLHRFYVNVGMGSVEVDAVEVTAARPRLDGCLVLRRWEDLVDGAPHRIEIRPDSDLDELASDIRRWLGDVVACLDTVDSTDALVDLAIEGNLLSEMERTCAYLARGEDIDRLRRYVGTLRERFGTDPRWTIFNRQLTEAVGAQIGVLRADGLLEETTTLGTA